MTESEAIALILQLNIRIFEVALSILHYASHGAAESMIDEHVEWLDTQMRELKTQMMIDELYND